jgi:hypothetical protein
MFEILEKITDFVTSFEGSILTISIIVEMAFRFFPSDKPLGILRMIASLMGKTGKLLIKISDLMDKVLPQKMK